MWKKIAMTLVPAVVVAAAGCTHVQGKQASDAAGRSERPPAASGADAHRREPQYREHSSLEAVRSGPMQNTGVPKSSEDLLSRMARDLSARLGVPVSALQVLTVESVVWNDGSLGCPQPGHAYTMAQVPGLRVLFQNAGKTYQYHASDRGQFVYCENPDVPAGSYERQ